MPPSNFSSGAQFDFRAFYLLLGRVSRKVRARYVGPKNRIAGMHRPSCGSGYPNPPGQVQIRS